MFFNKRKEVKQHTPIYRIIDISRVISELENIVNQIEQENNNKELDKFQLFKYDTINEILGIINKSIID